MRNYKGFFLFLILLYLLSATQVVAFSQADSSNVSNTILFNFNKSINEFYINTTKDLTDYFQIQFAFYSNLIKNLIVAVNINSMSAYLQNEVNRMIGNIFSNKLTN